MTKRHPRRRRLRWFAPTSTACRGDNAGGGVMSIRCGSRCHRWSRRSPSRWRHGQTTGRGRRAPPWLASRRRWWWRRSLGQRRVRRFGGRRCRRSCASRRCCPIVTKPITTGFADFAGQGAPPVQAGGPSRPHASIGWGTGQEASTWTIPTSERSCISTGNPTDTPTTGRGQASSIGQMTSHFAQRIPSIYTSACTTSRAARRSLWRGMLPQGLQTSQFGSATGDRLIDRGGGQAGTGRSEGLRGSR